MSKKTHPEPHGDQAGAPSLFDDPSSRAHRSVVVLSSNFTIGPLLARGCLLPPAVEDPSWPVGEPAYTFQQSTAGFSEAHCAIVERAGRNSFPIAVELKRGCSVRKTEGGHGHESIEGVLLRDVEGLVFRTSNELERFRVAEFGDYSLEHLSLALRAEPRRFGGQPPAGESPPEDLAPHSSIGERGDTEPNPAAWSDAVRRADCAAGFLASMLTVGTRDWMDDVQRLMIAAEHSDSLLGKAARAIGDEWKDASDLEEVLLLAFMSVGQRYPERAGWPAEEVLSEIESTARAWAEEIGVAEDLAKWASRTRSVLRASDSPQRMSDEAFVVQRALLLLLLRGTVESIGPRLNTTPTSLKIGRRVQAMATVFAATRSGLRALPLSHKPSKESRLPSAWLAFLGEFFWLALDNFRNPIAALAMMSPITVNYRGVRTLQGEWRITCADTELARIPAEFDPGLERLLTMGRHLGYELEEASAEGLRTTVPRGGSRAQPVYLSLVSVPGPEGPIVRFWSPTLNLVGKYAKSRLTKDFYIDLVTRNSRPDVNCRFALLESRNQIGVLADQLLGTLDEAEFKRHVEHVATVADDYEKEKGLDEQR